MRKTKIVCTLGPATDNPVMLRKLIKAGLNVARLNMSHGMHAEHAARIKMVKEIREELNVPVAIMLDTKGPEIRIRTFEGGSAELIDGDFFTLTTEQVEGNNARVAISYPLLPEKVKKGDAILINDGLVELCVDSVSKKEIVCTVVHGGVLTNRKSINLPDTEIDMPYLNEVDKADILFGISQNIEYFALSFVRNADDVNIIRSLLVKNNASEVQLISKIENRQGVNHIDEILEVSDGIMVARGDMGVEIPFEELPSIQKNLIKQCYRAGKIVITATQMLESMILAPRPTRAEISDVANAVFDGTSATMLSGETAVGKFPVETVKAMAKIIENAEKAINYIKRFLSLDIEIKSITDAVSHASCSAAIDLNAKAIIVVTQSGSTARKLSRFRPHMPIIAATSSDKVFMQLALNWGVASAHAVQQKNSDLLLEHAIDCAKATGIVKPGDLVVMTAGVPVGVSGNSNLMRIDTVK